MVVQTGLVLGDSHRHSTLFPAHPERVEPFPLQRVVYIPVVQLTLFAERFTALLARTYFGSLQPRAPLDVLSSLPQGCTGADSSRGIEKPKTWFFFWLHFCIKTVFSHQGTFLGHARSILD